MLDQVNVTQDTVSKNSTDMAAPSREDHTFTEADNGGRGGPTDTQHFFDQRGKMLDQNRVADSSNGKNDKGLVQLQPMSQLAASSTIVNLLLATGPFSYPYSFVRLGPILSGCIMVICCILAYISATFMVECIAMANSQTEDRRRDSVFREEAYKTPQIQRRTTDTDAAHKESEYYIRQKLELGVIADRIAKAWVKYTIMGILIVYMYGAMCLKYVSGAQSLYQGIAFIATGNLGAYDHVSWAYPISILVFGALCIAFSFGDIENSKWLQIISAWSRIVVMMMMVFGSVYYIASKGTRTAPVWDWDTQKDSLATVFGNTVFVFIYHHSIPGIIYPIRP
mmetsp:Transcript_5101/g.6254  ORF Transcript_5101/g.6254 Transcript_5101/m.6254 type:complete len:338 (+) Transcript_5101:52-1065(+)